MSVQLACPGWCVKWGERRAKPATSPPLTLTCSRIDPSSLCNHMGSCFHNEQDPKSHLQCKPAGFSQQGPPWLQTLEESEGQIWDLVDHLEERQGTRCALNRDVGLPSSERVYSVLISTSGPSALPFLPSVHSPFSAQRGGPPGHAESRGASAGQQPSGLLGRCSCDLSVPARGTVGFPHSPPWTPHACVSAILCHPSSSPQQVLKLQN